MVFFRLPPSTTSMSLTVDHQTFYRCGRACWSGLSRMVSITDCPIPLHSSSHFIVCYVILPFDFHYIRLQYCIVVIFLERGNGYCQQNFVSIFAADPISNKFAFLRRMAGLQRRAAISLSIWLTANLSRRRSADACLHWTGNAQSTTYMLPQTASCGADALARLLARHRQARIIKALPGCASEWSQSADNSGDRQMPQQLPM